MRFFHFFFPFVCALSGYGVAAWYWYVPPVRVPNVRGMSLTDGLRTLSTAGFSAEYCELSYEGDPVIADQFPSAGVLSKRRRSVRVMVPAGRTKHLMPDCSGMQIDAVPLGGVVTRVIHVPSDLPVGTVIGQYPAPDQPLESPLLIVAAHRSSRVIVPSLVGQSYADVRAFLDCSGVSLDCGGLPVCDECVVVGQWPKAGSLVDRAALTHLFCSFSCVQRHR